MRQLRHSLGQEDFDRFLEDACAALSKAGETEMAKTFSAFPAFLDEIETSYIQNDEKVKLAVRNLQLSSRELNEANENLENLNLSIRTMLDSLGEGLLIFGSDGICSQVFSASCVEMFGMEPAGRHIADVLGCDEAERAQLDNWLGIVFGGMLALSFDDMADLAPSRHKQENDYNLSLKYKPIMNAQGELRRILLVAADRSEEERAAERVAEQEKRALRILRLAKSGNHYIYFVHQCRDMIGRLFDRDGAADVAETKREMHTLKGIAAAFQLDEMAQTFHHLEKLYGEAQGDETAADIESALTRLENQLELANAQASEILGEGFEKRGETQRISKEILQATLGDITARLENGAERDAVEAVFRQRLMTVPLKDALQVFVMDLQQQCDRLGKSVTVVPQLEGVTVSGSYYTDFCASLTHLARNIADHGLEEPSYRRSLGKSPEGAVKMSARIDGEGEGRRLHLQIEDDGAGIDMETLRGRLPDGAKEASEAEIIALLLKGGLSSRSEVTLTSGRGVGLSAVHEAARELGGEMTLTTQSGAGTAFHFDLPYRI